MFKVTAYKNGQAIYNATVEDPNEIKILNTLKAMADTAKKLQDKGIQYDELVCRPLNLKVDIAKLIELFNAPTPLEIIALEAKHEAFA